MATPGADTCFQHCSEGMYMMSLSPSRRATQPDFIAQLEIKNKLNAEKNAEPLNIQKEFEGALGRNSIGLFKRYEIVEPVHVWAKDIIKKVALMHRTG